MDSDNVNYWVWNRLVFVRDLELRGQPWEGAAPEVVGCPRVRPAGAELSHRGPPD